jgi:uncharacterized protein YfaT (DUF1175 family)
MPPFRLFSFATAAIIAASFTFSTASLQGKWRCANQSGYQDPQTWYQINCSGDINFLQNGRLESNCTDIFLPNGVSWRAENGQLILSDSEGRDFQRYSYTFDDDLLQIVHKGVTFTFERR